MFQTPHVRLLVSDFPACFRFYRDVLGLISRFGSEEDVYAHFEVGDCAIAIARREVMAEAIGVSDEPMTSDSLGKAVVVFVADNVDDAVKTLREKDITIVAEPTDRAEWGCRTVHFRDPDGNLIEIYSAMPVSVAAS